MPSSLQQEIAEQRRWHLRPNYRYLQDQFESLVHNEFVAPEQQLARQVAQLKRLLQYSGSAVPYYRDLFARFKFDPHKINSMSGLAALPVLERRTVQEQGEQLHSEALPEGISPGGAVRTSGTSG